MNEIKPRGLLQKKSYEQAMLVGKTVILWKKKKNKNQKGVRRAGKVEGKGAEGRRGVRREMQTLKVQSLRRAGLKHISDMVHSDW